MSVRGAEEGWRQAPGFLPHGRAPGSPLLHQLPWLLHQRQPRRRHPGIRDDLRHGSISLSRWAALTSGKHRAGFTVSELCVAGTSSRHMDFRGWVPGEQSPAATVGWLGGLSSRLSGCPCPHPGTSISHFWIFSQVPGHGLHLRLNNLTSASLREPLHPSKM